MRVLGLTVAALAVLAAGCARDPISECPAIAQGELVVTEFRGPQTDMNDTQGIWVELANTASGTLDGETDIRVIVRRPLTVASGGYVVLGLFNDDERPAHVDYGFASDFKQGFLAAGVLELEYCPDPLSKEIDKARFENLPKTGTYSFEGTPTPDNNDVLSMWCPNPAPAGTPKAMNPPCP